MKLPRAFPLTLRLAAVLAALTLLSACGGESATPAAAASPAFAPVAQAQAQALPQATAAAMATGAPAQAAAAPGGQVVQSHERGVFFVTRAKENVVYKVKKRRPHDQDQGIIRDEVVVLGGQVASADYPGQLRRVTARVLIDGKEEILVLLTNNFAWAATSIAELYRCRWQIEAFFKQMKQTLQLADFLGTNANAVKWQIWTALLVYVLLRFQTWLSQWAHSFSRLFTLLRAALWQRRFRRGRVRSSLPVGAVARKVSRARRSPTAARCSAARGSPRTSPRRTSCPRRKPPAPGEFLRSRCGRPAAARRTCRRR